MQNGVIENQEVSDDNFDSLIEYNKCVDEWNRRFGSEVSLFRVTTIEESLAQRIKAFFTDRMTARQRVSYTEKLVSEFVSKCTIEDSASDSLKKSELALIVQNKSRLLKKEL
jgi:hypothetical protein